MVVVREGVRVMKTFREIYAAAQEYAGDAGQDSSGYAGYVDGYKAAYADGRLSDMASTLRGVLLFYHGGDWEQMRPEWKRLMGENTEASTRGMCDRIREVLGEPTVEEAAEREKARLAKEWRDDHA